MPDTIHVGMFHVFDQHRKPQTLNKIN